MICNFKTLLSKSVSAIIGVTFTPPTPCPAPISSPGLAIQVRTTETEMDREKGKVLLKSHCQFSLHPE
jgi:hypothetical protein